MKSSLLYRAIASVIVGAIFPAWLIHNHWFISENLSLANPLKWILVVAWIGGFLGGGAHSQSEIGAYLGAALASAFMTFVFLWGGLVWARKVSKNSDNHS